MCCGKITIFPYLFEQQRVLSTCSHPLCFVLHCIRYNKCIRLIHSFGRQLRSLLILLGVWLLAGYLLVTCGIWLVLVAMCLIFNSYPAE